MGCDIHAFIEYSRDGEHWDSFGGQINPGRYYGMFAKLANVRNDGSIIPIAEPRGMPESVSFWARSKYALYVRDEEDVNDEGACSRSSAERWVAEGSSIWLNEKHTIVSGPDWHSHSWVTLEELESALNEIKLIGGVEWGAVPKVMRHFEESGYKTRLLFWFDN